MNVILKSDIQGLGKAFDIVKVRDGYGRNWLLPQGLAIVASAANLRNLEADKKRLAGKIAKLSATAQFYLSQMRPTPPCRFDAVLLQGKAPATIEWLQNIIDS